jgi:hypothetical protein
LAQAFAWKVDYVGDGTPGISFTGRASQLVGNGRSCRPVTAVAPSSHHFVKWKNGGADYSTDATITVTNVTADMTLTANFAINTYAVTFQTDGTAGASLTGNTSQVVNHGSSCTAVTANAPANHHFVKWTLGGADYSTNATITVANVTSAMALTAHFALNEYVLTFATDGTPGATLDGPLTQTLLHGEYCDPVMAKASAGWHFVKWTKDGVDYTTASTVTAKATAPAAFVAVYAEGDPPGTMYSVMVTAQSGGTVNGQQSLSFSVPSGGDCPAVEPSANVGHQFMGWTGSVTGTATPLTLANVTRNMSVTGNFIQEGYLVEFETDGTAGAVLFGDTSQTVEYGAYTTPVQAVAPPGWYFVRWARSDTLYSRVNPIAVRVYSDATYVAQFAEGVDPETRHTITATAGAGGVVSPSGAVSVVHGDNAEFIVMSDPGYRIADVEVDGSSVGPVSLYLFPSVSEPHAITATFAANGVNEVVGTHVFYNNSAWDLYDPAPGEADDQAIALDKVALRPGGTAAFANYTSFSKGINGIMVDIAGLADTPTADDFALAVGNDNDPAAWSAGPAPAAIAVRSVGGGISRVTLTWADNAIQKQWLQVTVQATARTGLPAPYSFLFGNAIGETGNRTTDAIVNTSDQVIIRSSQTAPGQAGIANVHDINRDKRVSSADQVITRSNLTGVATALKLISLP